MGLKVALLSEILHDPSSSLNLTVALEPRDSPATHLPIAFLQMRTLRPRERKRRFPQASSSSVLPTTQGHAHSGKLRFRDVHALDQSPECERRALHHPTGPHPMVSAPMMRIQRVPHFQESEDHNGNSRMHPDSQEFTVKWKEKARASLAGTQDIKQSGHKESKGL